MNNRYIQSMMDKIHNREDLALILKEMRKGNKPDFNEEKPGTDVKIIFTNGCFDILHKGHIAYLAQARALGDILVVALNSDSSVSRIKGESRPVNTLEDRLFMLAGFEFIDYLTWFDEDNPVKTLKVIHPDVHVKGGDYRPEDLIEYGVLNKMGIDLKILPFVDGYSTSGLINKIGKNKK